MSGFGLTNPCPTDSVLFYILTGLTVVLIAYLTYCKVDKSLMRIIERRLTDYRTSNQRRPRIQTFAVCTYGRNLLRDFRFHNFSSVIFTCAGLVTYFIWLGRCEFFDEQETFLVPEVLHLFVVVLIVFRIGDYQARLKHVERAAGDLL